jgi:hypothetical protein
VTHLEGDYVFGRWFDATFGAHPTATTSVHHFDELEEVVAMVGLGYGASVVPLDAARPPSCGGRCGSSDRREDGAASTRRSP